MSSHVRLGPDEHALAARLAEDLARALTAAGWLRSPPWRAALAQVPRHHFAPRFWLAPGLGGGTFDGTADEDREAWLRAVYAHPDQTLITQQDGDDQVTSSCSAPAVVVGMLEELQVESGMRVLEIGTGTGWNAGLLAARLGSSLVTSVDISEELVAAARDRLAALDLHPTLAVADGEAGYPPRAPYDRIIATCAVRRVPLAWLAQVKPGGMIQVDLRGSIGGALARIRVGSGGSAHGEFLALPFSFMPMRSPHLTHLSRDDLGELGGRAASAAGHQRASTLDPAVLDDESFGFLAQLHLPGCLAVPIRLVDGPAYFCLIDPASGSWARRDDHGVVTQDGPRQLWDDLERAHTWWLDHQQPPPHHFRVALKPTGEQHVTLADGASASTWQLPL